MVAWEEFEGKSLRVGEALSEALKERVLMVAAERHYPRIYVIFIIMPCSLGTTMIV